MISASRSAPGAAWSRSAWIRETFRYSAAGPVGLLTGKRACVFAARGGLYAGTALDTQTQYVRDFLFIYAEGLAIDAERRESALGAARTRIEALFEPARVAA